MTHFYYTLLVLSCIAGVIALMWIGQLLRAGSRVKSRFSKTCLRMTINDSGFHNVPVIPDNDEDETTMVIPHDR